MAERIELRPDEFAFYFETKRGVDADALADFLKRAATIARRRGAELQVVGLPEGSLAVVIRALKKLGHGAAREFSEKPIDTTIKVSGFVGGIVYAIVHAMSPEQSGSTPIAKAGAEIVEKHHVTQITIMTNETSVVVMNQKIASEVHRAEERQNTLLAQSESVERIPRQVVEMIEDARAGSLSGQVELVDEELHFRPDGYRYWVPVDQNPVTAQGQLFPGGHFRVKGHIATRDGQPDRIVVDRAERIN